MNDPITRLNAALEGRYRIEREIGEGGMATVYLADDLRHERKVALKVLKPELAAVVGADRFLAEIKTTANLQHPHILPLFDSGEADDFLFFVMPYVTGDTLRDKIDREKQLGVAEAIRITEKVASALDYAHRQGVVHRDIKPGNILLSPDGEPTVADFGIALAVAQAGGGRVTETGLSVGTPHYMSPEQATGGRDVDPRTDIYALGCVLYEMLIGEPPYTGSTAQAILGKIIQGDAVSATDARSTVPPNVDAAIRKATEKLPADRFMTAQEFAKALGDPGFRHGAGALAGTASGPGLWNPLSMAASVLAIVFGVGFGWALFRPEPPEPVERFVLSTEGVGGPGVRMGLFMAIAPDGSSMVLPVQAAGGTQLGLKVRGSAEIAPIPGTEGASNPVYSPDGQSIAYRIRGDLFRRPIAGGSAARLADDAESGVSNSPVGVAWLDDGTILYERSAGELVQVPENGGEPRVVFQPNGQTNWVRGLPGARAALVGHSQGSVVLIDLRDLSSRVLLEETLGAWYAPTGHLVLVRDDGVVSAVRFDLDTLEIVGGETRLFSGVRIAFSLGTVAEMQLGEDGSLIYSEGTASGGNARLAVVDLEGNRQILPLAPRIFTNLGPSWSPDGESVVFSSENQIYTYNVLLNTTPRQITFEGANTNPAYSPDGTRVAFSSIRDGTDGWDLFVKDLNDDSPPRSIISLDARQSMRQWPTDTLIVFEQEVGGGQGDDLWMVDISDPENPEAGPYLTSEGDLGGMVVSPDGRLAAYRSDESGAGEIYIRSFPNAGERTVVSRGGGGIPFWSPDGSTLYYALSGGLWMTARLQREPVPTVLSLDTLFTSLPMSLPPSAGSALHPDGDRFIITTEGGDPEVEGEAPAFRRLILVQNFFEELRRLVPN